MWWEKPLKNYRIVTFTHDQILLRILAEYFAGMAGITIINLVHMDERIINKFMSKFDIDIAFIEEKSIDSVPVRNIIEEAMLRHGVTTHFVLRYDDECAEKMMDFGDRLLKKKLPITQCRLDEEEDCTILAQTIHSILMWREQQEIRRMEVLKQELSGLLHNQE